MNSSLHRKALSGGNKRVSLLREAADFLPRGQTPAEQVVTALVERVMVLDSQKALEVLIRRIFRKNSLKVENSQKHSSMTFESHNPAFSKQLIKTQVF